MPIDLDYRDIHNNGEMTYDDVIKFFGTQSAAAAALGLHQSSISDWKRDGITNLRQLHIEAVTKGKLKADPEAKKPEREWRVA